MVPRLLHPDHALLMVIDIQEKFIPVIQDIETLIAQTCRMVETARRLEIPVIVTEQYTKGLGPTVAPIRTLLPTGTPVLEKSTFSCLGEDDIAQAIDNAGRNQLMICGIEAQVCVNQTVHQLLALGYEPHLIQDAISSRTPENLRTGLEKMIQSGAVPSCTEMAMFELLRNAQHPQFKDFLALIKNFGAPIRSSG